MTKPPRAAGVERGGRCPPIIGRYSTRIGELRDDVCMDDLMREIRAAIGGGAWVLALFGTIALPDICAALGSLNGQSTGSKYKNWVRGNLSDKYPHLDPEELWQMRCSLLHQGNSSTRSYSRVVFVAPGGGNVFHNNVLNDALNLDLPTFCEDVMSAAESWFEANATNPTVAKNAESLVRWHRGGLSPYVVGLDVLS